MRRECVTLRNTPYTSMESESRGWWRVWGVGANKRERLTERERHWSSSSSSNIFRCRAHAEALGTRRESVAFWHLLISPITSTNSTEHHNACVCGDQTSENTHTSVGRQQSTEILWSRSGWHLSMLGVRKCGIYNNTKHPITKVVKVIKCVSVCRWNKCVRRVSPLVFATEKTPTRPTNWFSSSSFVSGVSTRIARLESTFFSGVGVVVRIVCVCGGISCDYNARREH